MICLVAWFAKINNRGLIDWLTDWVKGVSEWVSEWVSNLSSWIRASKREFNGKTERARSTAHLSLRELWMRGWKGTKWNEIKIWYRIEELLGRVSAVEFRFVWCVSVNGEGFFWFDDREKARKESRKGNSWQMLKSSGELHSSDPGNKLAVRRFFWRSRILVKRNDVVALFLLVFQYFLLFFC